MKKIEMEMFATVRKRKALWQVKVAIQSGYSISTGVHFLGGIIHVDF
jgi:hypothetical protein